jgi:toxin ParE1/3/4
VTPLELRITPRALDQLNQIQTELEEQRSGRGEKFFTKLDEVGEHLLLFPEMGVAKEALGEGIRSYVVWEYMMLYRITDTQIRVEAIIHGARDIEAAFLDE